MLIAASSPARTEVLFRVDFENGLKATGTNGGEPKGSAGGGFEILREGAEKLLGATVTEAFPARGKHCLQLGHYVVWKTGIGDRSPAQLSFWILPVVLPSNGAREIVWGGDHAKSHQTFWIKLHPDGKISANYWSFQRQNWLSGVTSGVGIKPKEWSQVTFAWGPKGQRIFINGQLAGGNDDKEPPAWVFDLKFGIHPMCLDDIQVADSDEPAAFKPVDTPWQPTGAIKDVFDIISGAEALSENAPRGSDAYCRGLIIKYVAMQNMHLAMWEPMTALTADDFAWMRQALTQTKPRLRGGEIPVPPFEASKKIKLQDGRILQNGSPTFLIGLFGDGTAIDQQIGFNLADNLMGGPDYTFPNSQAVGDCGAGVAASIKRATADNKAIDLLVSLGIPQWVDQAGPFVRESGCDNFSYNIEAPVVREFFKRFVDVVVPNIKGHGANVIINLCNEPSYSGFSPNTTAIPWRLWLMSRHGSIEKLNKAWGRNYKSFLEVEGPAAVKSEHVSWVPGAAKLIIPTDPKVLGQFYDWCQFNQERLADFFREIRDRIKYRGDFLFTIKWLMVFPSDSESFKTGLNPYYVTKLTDFGGNDAWTMYAGRDPNCLWGLWWEDSARMFDLLKSICPEKPLLNAEDHLLRGYDPADKALKYGTYRDPLPWQFFYTALWHQAIHGVAGMELWTYWEGTKGYNLNERAKALDALSQVTRDLRRHAREVSAVANGQPRIALLLSTAALTWSHETHMEATMATYKAMNQLGVPVGYMLEEMVPDGALGRYDLLVVPQATHISQAMNDAITRFAASGKTVVVLGDIPSADEYGKPIKFTGSAVVWADVKPLPKAQKDAFDAMHPDSLSSDDIKTRKIQVKLDVLLKEKKLAGPVRAVVNGELPYGIEWRTVTVDGKLVTNITNFTAKSFEVDLTTAAGPLKAVNLLDCQKVAGKLHLDPMGVALLKQK